MKILYRHIEQFINKKINFNNLIIDLEDLGLEVESSSYYDYEKVEIVKITEIEQHPNADRLHIVTTTNGKTTHKIVCGAQNIEIGQIVPFAQIGAILDDIIIAKAKIRGIESAGMLCSSRELGVNNDHSGIMILSQSYKLGDKLSKYLKNPSVIDVNITPNRPDWLSTFGISREIAAKYKIALPELTSNRQIVNKDFRNNPNDDELAQSYYLVKIDNITHTTTPQEILDDLRQMDLNPKGNILIDLTNWAMYVFGQPLHAFDADKICGQISIRKAQNNETIKLLNGNELVLKNSDVVISDEKEAIALAGIMGGDNSAISDATKNIYLESASFIPNTIRKSVISHEIISDASVRFEKGVKPIDNEKILSYVLDIIMRLNQDAIVDKIEGQSNYCDKIMQYSPKDLKRICNLSLTETETLDYLSRLGYKGELNKLLKPSWRYDLNFQEDISEDIIRLYGLNNLSAKSLSVSKIEYSSSNTYIRKLAIKEFLRKYNFNEILNLSFCSRKELSAFEINPETCLKVINPISSEIEVLRPSLVFGIIETLKQNPEFKSHLLYEIGNVFLNENKTEERIIFASTKDKLNVFKSAISELKLDLLNIKEIDCQILEKFKIRIGKIFYLEYKIDLLPNNLRFSRKKDKPVKYTQFSSLPCSIKDVSFWLNPQENIEHLINELKNIDSHLLIIEQFDEYTDAKINKTAIALRFVLQPEEKSFTENEINDIFNKIINNIKNRGLEIR